MESTNTFNTSAAQLMNDDMRKHLALSVIKNDNSITDAANQNKVSRKFIHGLKDKAIAGIDQAFESEEIGDEKILFHLPVTKSWLQQLVLCLLLHSRASFRGIIKVFEDAFDSSISIGTIHNISNAAKEKAKEINAAQDLSKVKLAANDEIFQYNKPVLAGVDIPSLYCYLLSQEQRRDAETWAIHLWDLEKQGYHPERVFADGGDGLRAGHEIALPGVPCDADHFHIMEALTEMRRFFRNRLKSAITHQKKMEEKMEKAKQYGEGQQHARALGLARAHQAKMEYLSESIDTLVNWMGHDVLNMAGPKPVVREELYDFILAELNKLADSHPHRIRSVCTTLNNQRNLLLAFTEVLDEKFKLIAEKFECSKDVAWEVCQLQRYKHGGDHYAVKSLPLLFSFGEEKLDYIEDAVISAMNGTERTSSMIENLNSRLRPYFFLRREIGFDYLELLRFYLNHTPFLRSETNRAKKTPAELLTGKPHAHWLEMLGYQRFKRAA